MPVRGSFARHLGACEKARNGLEKIEEVIARDWTRGGAILLKAVLKADRPSENALLRTNVNESSGAWQYDKKKLVKMLSNSQYGTVHIFLRKSIHPRSLTSKCRLV